MSYLVDFIETARTVQGFLYVRDGGRQGVFNFQVINFQVITELKLQFFVVVMAYVPFLF